MNYSDKLKEHAERLLAQTPEEQVAEMARALKVQNGINVNSAFNEVEKAIRQKGSFRRTLEITYRVAASLFIPMLILTIWSLTRTEPVVMAEYTFQEISTQPGMRSRVVLPDGTGVWLNAESTISYQVPFQPDRRMVTLEGEAYFEVEHDPGRPMVISAGNLKAEVLGTSFNIKAYNDEEKIEVALTEGSLRISLPEVNARAAPRTMLPGDRALIEGTGITVSRERLEKYTSWRYGNLVFDETSMQELARKLERWYGVEVVIGDKSLNSYRFTTTFSNQSLSQVLELLELSSPISIKYQPGNIGKATEFPEKGKVYIGKKRPG